VPAICSMAGWLCWLRFLLISVLDYLCPSTSDAAVCQDFVYEVRLQCFWYLCREWRIPNHENIRKVRENKGHSSSKYEKDSSPQSQLAQSISSSPWSPMRLVGMVQDDRPLDRRQALKNDQNAITISSMNSWMVCSGIVGFLETT
jgi:hypothetical protein